MSKLSTRPSTPTHRPRSFWLRFARDATPSQQQRFIDTYQRYVYAAKEQVVNRIDQTCLSIESYVELRRHASAIWVRGSLNPKRELPLN
jgi:ABC-type transporter MlaC component